VIAKRCKTLLESWELLLMKGPLESWIRHRTDMRGPVEAIETNMSARLIPCSTLDGVLGGIPYR
jgi:hypothetical protein